MLFVTDSRGNPVPDAKVFWASGSRFACQGSGRIISIYSPSGEGLTDATGHARFPEAGPRMRGAYGLLVVGKGGEKTLSSVPA